MITQKDNQSSSSNFADLLKQDIIKVPQVGDIVTGVVLSASKAEVRLDIDGVAIGIVRGRELYQEAEEYANLKSGDKIEATVIEEENENGELELSFRHAGQQRAWANLIDAYENKKIIKIKVNDANKGGLVVSFGQIAGFLPVSQLAPENYPRVSGGDRGKILEKLRSFISNEIEVKIVTLNQEEEKFIVSERDAWQEKQKDIILKYKVGSSVEGKITAITDFGVFVTFGKNLEGLIHISELAWQRIDSPSDLFKVGDKVKAEIISIDGSKIFLSAKKLIKDPWKEVAKKYKENQTVTGTILKVNPFGLFIGLDKDIHGLAHISQLNLAPGQKINQVFKAGDKQKFIVASIEPEDHRLGLVVGKQKAESENTKTLKHKNIKTQKHKNTKTESKKDSEYKDDDKKNKENKKAESKDEKKGKKQESENIQDTESVEKKVAADKKTVAGKEQTVKKDVGKDSAKEDSVKKIKK